MPTTSTVAGRNSSSERAIALRGIPYQFFGLRDGRALVALPAKGTVIACDELGLHIMGTASAFRTTEELIGNFLSQFPMLGPVEDQELLDRVEQLVGAGAFVSWADLAAGRPEVTAESPARVSWVALPTQNRPRELCRALSSYVENARKFGSRYGILITDGSDEQLTRQAVSEAAAYGGPPIRYLGGPEKLQFCEQLARRADVPPNVVQTALFGFRDGSISTGANRNTILLATVGELLITADDDTLCRVACKIDAELPTLAFRGHDDPQVVSLYADRECVLGSRTWEDRDWVAEHERVLGASPFTIMRAFLRTGVMPQLESACPHVLEMLMRGTGRVTVSIGGSAGDSGYQRGSSFLLHPDPLVRRQLISSESEFWRLLHSREIVRESLDYSIAHVPGTTQAMFAGLDNRDILPPFFPSYRNQDGVFGAITGLCVRDACFAHVPIVMQHIPGSFREFDPSGIGRLRVCDWIFAACSLWSPGPVMDSNRRIKSLGWHLEALGALPQAEFCAVMMPPVFTRLAAVIKQIEAVSAEHNYREYWVKEVDVILERFVSSALDPDYLVPSDIDVASVPNRASHLREMIRTYGQLLSSWPELVVAAKELAAAGVRPWRAVEEV